MKWMYLVLVLILVVGVVGLSGCTSSTNNTTTTSKNTSMPGYSAPIKTVSNEGIHWFNTKVESLITR
jgi:uncharacterized protein YceK